MGTNRLPTAICTFSFDCRHVGFGQTDYSHLYWLDDIPLSVEGKDLSDMPLAVASGISDQTHFFVAHVKDGRLLFMKEDENGLPLFKMGIMGDKKYSIHMEFDESDLVDLLKGVYKLYSRDKRELPRIIDIYLNNPHK